MRKKTALRTPQQRETSVREPGGLIDRGENAQDSATAKSALTNRSHRTRIRLHRPAHPRNHSWTSRTANDPVHTRDWGRPESGTGITSQNFFSEPEPPCVGGTPGGGLGGYPPGPFQGARSFREPGGIAKVTLLASWALRGAAGSAAHLRHTGRR